MKKSEIIKGIIQMHKLEVVTQDGQSHPHFELATKAEADAYRAAQAKRGEAQQ